MVQSMSEPSVKEVITFIDNEWAKFYLVTKLSEIPEFIELWSRARELATVVVEAILTHLQKSLAAMSPAGRGALAALTSGDTLSYTTPGLSRRQWTS